MRHALAALFALALVPGGSAAAPAAEDPGHTVTLVTDDVSVPVAMAFIGPDDFLVLEKEAGRVQRFAGGTKSEVRDLAVNGCGERGLLGIAVHPDFGADVDRDWVYLYYTAAGEADDIDDCNVETTNQVDRFTWNGSTLESPTPILTLPSDEGSHNGGTLAFGPDGKLYGVIGDNQRDGRLQNNPDDMDPPDDTGIIFRLDDDGAIPTDNPFDVDHDGLDPEDKIYAYGIRNSFGLAFDPESGDLWDTENGPEVFDEINRVLPGFNSGWRPVMGPASPNPPPGLVDLLPVSTYADPAYSIETPVAVTALAFATDDSALGSAYAGDLFVADFLAGQIYRFELTGGRDALDVTDPVAGSQNELNRHRFASGFDGGIGDLEEGPDGALYALAIGGGIYKIEGVHDLALASLKAPRRARVAAGGSVTRKLAVSVVNHGTVTETVADLGQLGALVTLTANALGSCPAPVPALEPPKHAPPFVLAPGKKLKLAYTVALDCAAADPAEVELEWGASVGLDALGAPDAVPANDACPRAAAGDDEGCGKPPGSPIRTDVVAK